MGIKAAAALRLPCSGLNSEFTCLAWHQPQVLVQVLVMPWKVFAQGPVVQKWVSANPGLKFNLLF
jgi:hypothetical protein